MRVSSEIEIGKGKRGRRGYSLDDIAIIPARRTRDPEDVSLSWQIDAYHFELPFIGAPMDSAMSPDTAIALGQAVREAGWVVVLGHPRQAGRSGEASPRQGDGVGGRRRVAGGGLGQRQQALGQGGPRAAGGPTLVAQLTPLTGDLDEHRLSGAAGSRGIAVDEEADPTDLGRTRAQEVLEVRAAPHHPRLGRGWWVRAAQPAGCASSVSSWLLSDSASYSPVTR